MEVSATEWLEVSNLDYAAGNQPVIRQLSFTMCRGTRLALMGATGSGKSTLLKIIGGLVQPDSGAVWFEGARVPGPLETLIPGHPHIAYLSQQADLRPNFFVHEVLEYASLMQDTDRMRLYQLCEIDHLLNRKTTQLSGGEKQRVALARLLTTQPRLLLLDEPFAHLDYAHKATIQRVLHNAAETLGFSSILVSHDAADVLAWAHHLMIIQHGCITQQGHPLALFEQPADAATALLLGPVNKLPAAMAAALCAQPLHEASVYLIRPAFIRQVEPPEGLPCKVETVKFTGKVFEVTASSQHISLLYFAHHTPPQTGDIVYLQASAEKIFPQSEPAA